MGPAVAVVVATMAANVVGTSNPKSATVPSTVPARRLVVVILASCTVGPPRWVRRTYEILMLRWSVTGMKPGPDRVA
jgi:hypothetical protein